MPLVRKYKQPWEDLGTLDPLWAILTAPGLKFGKWDVEEFFRTGEQDLARVMQVIEPWKLPRQRERALDFGCGVGRMTRALALHFRECCGVDIAQAMITRARELNRAFDNCRFFVNSEPHLRLFPEGHFDLIYSRIVLQHIPCRSLIRSYIAEFVRTLKTGGLLVFQLPSYIPRRERHQMRARLYGLLRAVGFGNRFLYEKLGLCPIRMNSIPEKDVIEHIQSVGGKVLEAQADGSTGLSIESRLYLVTREK